MQITKMEPAGRKIRIFLNDEEAFCLKKSETDEYGLALGEELPRELYDAICEEKLLPSAKMKALTLLNTRDHTEHELRMKLLRSGYPDGVAEGALAYVKSFHYIDDAAYARRYLEQNRERFGENKIRRDLLQKGIDPEQIREAMRDLEEENPADSGAAIRYWLEKRRYDSRNATEKDRAKQIRFLAGKGFSLHDILKELSRE